MLRTDALSIFHAGVNAVKPGQFIPRFVRRHDHELIIDEEKLTIGKGQKIIVIAVGKAASAMAQETEKILGGRITEGLAVTKYAHSLPLQYCRTIEAAHPVPDSNSVAAGKAVVELLKKTTADDIIILLISGGASALLADYPPGSSLQDLQQVSTLLLHSGAAIDDMNTVRKHLSLIKGGQLMRYVSGKVFALLLSDVPGDDLSVIASGLTAPDNSSFDDMQQILEKYNLAGQLPAAIDQWLQKGLKKEIPDTPKPRDPIFQHVKNILVATNAAALRSAEKKAVELGYHTEIISQPLEGDAAEQAGVFVSKLKNAPANTCLLWGGETTVVVKGKGKGGRNQHFALVAANILHELSLEDLAVLSAGTDGTDGPTEAAGAIADRNVIKQMLAKKLDPGIFLNNNDAFHFFEQTNGLVITGPTQTNVMDIVIGLKK
ncbi:MAG: DUF4147 domain-containing protein [Chitinophagaceae bacterium]|nr:DUF4147 domain-containing protein [Chitinophagaceae bacterium]MCW5925711.1 DUF4147 domain-containing protein [Chitinophagaceae bacterium]